MITLMQAAAGIALFATIQSIWLGSLSKNVQIFRSYGFVCLFIAIYTIATAVWYQADTLDQAVTAAQWQTFSGLGHVVAFTWLIVFMAKAQHSKPVLYLLIPYTAAMASLAITAVTTPLSFYTASLEITGKTTLLFQTVTDYQAVNTTEALLLNVLAIATFCGCAVATRRIYLLGNRGEAIWLASYIILQTSLLAYRVIQGHSFTEHQSAAVLPVIWLLGVISICFAREHHRTVAALHEQKAKLKQRAYFDTITGLPNEHWLREELPSILANSQHERLLILTHIHDFRAIRRIFGNERADDLIRQVAGRIKQLVEPTDILAHMQDDTFCVLRQTPGASRYNQGAADTRSQLHQSLLAPYFIGRQAVNLNLQMGIVDVSQPDSLENAIYFAHLALAEAARRGVNETTFFDNSLVEKADRARLLQDALPHAIARKELALYYQPKVDHRGNCLGAEALLRWQHSELGYISPVDFIPLAEQSGIMPELGNWVIEQACEFLKTLKQNETQLPGRLSINVSPWQLLDGQLEETLTRYLIDSDVAPSSFEIELTESALVDTRAAATQQLQRIQKLGVSIAVDDFGTGYSSLAYLQNLPLNVLKIDKQFVDKLHDQHGTQLVKGIIDIGHALEMQLIAEGVETKEQADTLLGLGCEIFQGYYFSKPLAQHQFLEWLTESDYTEAEAC